jgi:hypothetical protein
MLELDGECRDSRFILVRALDRDRVITLRPVDVSLCVGLIILSFFFLLIGVPTASLYIGRGGCGAVTILVGSKEGVLN